MVLGLFALLGVLTALAYTASLAWNTRLYLSARTAGWAVVLHLARTVAVVAALVGFALAGTWPFVVALVAFTCTYAAAVFASRRRA